MALSMNIVANELPSAESISRLFGFPLYIVTIIAKLAFCSASLAIISARLFPPRLIRTEPGKTDHKSRVNERTRFEVLRDVVISKEGNYIGPTFPRFHD